MSWQQAAGWAAAGALGGLVALLGALTVGAYVLAGEEARYERDEAHGRW